MKIIDDIKLNKALNTIELYLCENEKKQPVLAVLGKDFNKIIHLKRFFGRAQFRKWILEAALLHILLGDSYKKELSRIYRNLSKTLMDNKRDETL